VKPKIVASRGFSHMWHRSHKHSHFAKQFTKWLQLHQRSHFIRVATATAILATAETLPKAPEIGENFKHCNITHGPKRI
jgi:hypothetical protein